MKTERTRRLPAFFTQTIGSLPRPAVVRQMLADRSRTAWTEFQARMDDMVLFAIRLQEQVGLDVVSDGEWRRSQYIRELLDRIGGFQKIRQFRHQGEVKRTEVVVERISAGQPAFQLDARFLVERTDRVTKFALPSPFLIAIRYWHQDYSRDAYPTREHFLAHLTEILAAEARSLVEAGIDVVQIPAPPLPYFCDRDLMAGAESHDQRLALDWNVDRQLPQAVEAINQIAEGLTAEVHLHCCHSVYKRRSDVRGDYKPILPRLKQLKVDRLNLEFAYTGTGDVSDLDWLPEDLDVGMGVVDVRSEEPTSTERMEALAEAGAARLGPHRIALNPDCGFAPDAAEPPTIDEAYQKLRLLVAAAQRLRARIVTG